MRRTHRIVLLAGLLAFAPALVGCENLDMDKLDVFGINQKKKLPGERKELFPGGVPGVTQGIPPEYLKGNQPPPDTAQAPAGEPANSAAAEPGDKADTHAPVGKTAAIAPADEPKPKPKRKPKPRPAANPPTQITVKPATKDQNNDQQPLEPWPTTPQGQQPSSGQSSSTAPWPSSSPPPGTFSR
jgi:outer membrane biosynthesis protein TonB